MALIRALFPNLDCCKAQGDALSELRYYHSAPEKYDHAGGCFLLTRAYSYYDEAFRRINNSFEMVDDILYLFPVTNTLGAFR